MEGLIVINMITIINIIKAYFRQRWSLRVHTLPSDSWACCPTPMHPVGRPQGRPKPRKGTKNNILTMECSNQLKSMMINMIIKMAMNQS